MKKPNTFLKKIKIPNQAMLDMSDADDLNGHPNLAFMCLSAFHNAQVVWNDKMRAAVGKGQKV